MQIITYRCFHPQQSYEHLRVGSICISKSLLIFSYVQQHKLLRIRTVAAVLLHIPSVCVDACVHINDLSARTADNGECAVAVLHDFPLLCIGTLGMLLLNIGTIEL